MKKIILLISLVSLLFISCENSLSKIENLSLAENSTNTPAVTTRPSEDGKTYITFGDINFENESRTINPVYNRDDLTALYIKGMETNKVTPTTKPTDYTTLFGLYNPKATSYEDLCTKTFEITPGVWNFILYATLYDFEFSGMTTVEVKPGMTHALSFTLATTNTSSYPYGIIDITVDFTGNADRVVATLKEKSTSTTARITKTYTPTDTKNPISTVEGETYKRINFKTANTSSSSSGGVTAGKYYLLFEFFQDGFDEPINTVENTVRVENNFTTKKTLNLDLDELYTITYSYWEGTAGFDATELESLTFDPATTVLPSVYSRKSETFILPTPSLPGYTFDAWYKSSEFTNENKITQITQGSIGDLELYANFVAQGGGGNSSGTPDGLAYVNLGLPSGTLWANMNVGATSVTDIGTQYEWMDGGVDLTQLSAGDTMPSENDLATINFGADWCMPTKEQFEELYNYCYFEPVTSYNGSGVSGYIAFKAKNENDKDILAGCGLNNIEEYKRDGYDVNTDPHIFIPADNNDVYLWSSTYYGDSYGGRDQNAYCFFFVDQYEPIETEIIKTTTTDEWEKHPIRPVYVGSTGGSGGNGSSSNSDDFVTVTGGTFSTDNHVGTVENDNDYNAGTLTIPNLEVCSHMVTQYEYEQLMTYYGVAQSNSALIPTETSEEDKKNTPAYFVTWLDAIVYCNLLSEAEGLTPVYSLSDNNEITAAGSPWTTWGNISMDGTGKYYYNQTDLESHNDISTYDLDAASFSYDLSANGYRLPTTAEYQNIKTINPDLLSGAYDEWCQNYYTDYQRCKFDASENEPVSDIYADTRENKLGFRVVRNAGANGGSNP